MLARVQSKFSINPVTEQRQRALILTGEKDTFHPSNPFRIFFLLYCTSFFALHICQVFTKQLEGVSFPWSSRQLFPISPASWKSLQTSLSPQSCTDWMCEAVAPSGEDLWFLQSLSLKLVCDLTKKPPASPKGTIWKCLACKACTRNNVTLPFSQPEGHLLDCKSMSWISVWLGTANGGSCKHLLFIISGCTSK